MKPMHHMRSAGLATLFVFTLASGATENERSEPSRRPTREQMSAVTMPAYKPTPDSRQECLGRLVWQVDGKTAWPVKFDLSGDAPFAHIFSERVFSPGDEIHFGNTRIKVTELDQRIKDKILSSAPTSRLARMSKELPGLEAELVQKEKLKNGNVRDRNRYELAKSDVESQKKTIAEMQARYREFSPGLSDSYGYWTTSDASSGTGAHYSTYRAYLFRQNFLYVFESEEEIAGAMTVEKHRKQFLALLSSFRTRNDNEIPSDLGVCIPHGFIPDDGRTVTDIKQSVRWTDAPGVLYTIHTGNVQPRQLKSTVMTAVANSQVGRFGSNEEAEVRPHVDQRIGPRQVPIGGLIGEQGGVALKVTRAGAKPYEAYSVFTGYAGWLSTDVLPFILVDMQTFSMEQAPELKVNPPPFKQSMQRLEGMLKNMRLRPTTPAMPELR